MKLDEKSKVKLLRYVESFNKRYGCQFDIDAYEDTLIKVMEEAAKENAPENETSEKIDKIYKDTFTEIYKQIIQNVNEGKIARPKGYTVLVHFEQELISPLVNLRALNRYKTLGNSMGGLKPSERNKFIADIEATVPYVEQQPKELDLSKLLPVVEKFNTIYGCNFDLDRYIAALDEFKNDSNTERKNNLFQSVFMNLYGEALESLNSKKIDIFEAEDMLDDFEYEINSVLFELREDAGINEVTDDFGGTTYQQRQEFFKEHEDRISKLRPKVVIQRGSKEYDINKFQDAINTFNQTYGCQLDIKKYTDALKNFGNDETPERINQTYKDIFAEVNKQALRSALEGKITFNSSLEMLNDFQSNIIAPILIESGYDKFAEPFGGMTRLEQLELMKKCINEVPSNLVYQALEKYETGKLTLKQMFNRANEICINNESATDNDKKEFMSYIMALETSYNNRENKNSGAAKKELEHIEAFRNGFIENFKSSEYKNFHMITPHTFKALYEADREITIDLIKCRNIDQQQKAEKEYQEREIAEAKAEAEAEAARKEEEARARAATPTKNVMERYTKGRFPLRQMRALASGITNNPTSALEEDKTHLAACISAIEQIHSTRTTAWMFRHPMRYYSEYRDARDMKEAFIKAFGEKQYEISKACADHSCTESQYIKFKAEKEEAERRAREQQENEIKMPKEVMHFREEEINGKAPQDISKPIDEIAPPSKSGREFD